MTEDILKAKINGYEMVIEGYKLKTELLEADLRAARAWLKILLYGMAIFITLNYFFG